MQVTLLQIQNRMRSHPGDNHSELSKFQEKEQIDVCSLALFV